MAKKRYIKFEYSIIILALLAAMLFLVPFSLEGTRQASNISKWNEVYNRVEYMFSVMNAHVDDDMIKSLKRAQTTLEREQILLMIIKPYLRIDNQLLTKRYKPRYKNGNKILQDDLLYFNEFYNTKWKYIIGIKNIHTAVPSAPLFIMMFDVNGILPPNRWGVDIFGINIYDGGKIQPFGYDKPLDELDKDCSKDGLGVGCSYYYKIGGEF